jgi:lipopolysaccharide biosynthesis glycosyltransferase
VPKKILWLDSDTIIMKDILPLWNINIEKHNLAAAIDHGTFFQNAVMLLNLNPKSKDNIIKIFTDVCKFYKTTNYGAWGDMKVINKLKKIYQLDNIYNSWQPLKKTVIFHYCHLFNITKFSDKKHEFFYNLKLKKDRRMLWVSKKDMPNKKSIKIESPIFWKKYKKLQHWNLALESAKSTINK